MESGPLRGGRPPFRSQLADAIGAAQGRWQSNASWPEDFGYLAQLQVELNLMERWKITSRKELYALPATVRDDMLLIMEAEQEVEEEARRDAARESHRRGRSRH